MTPSFNQGHFLEETICSVLDQGYPNLEYIIIDGGSTDNSVEVIRKYQKHLSYWISEADQGQSDAINKGLAYCTGEVFNWLNSDDLLMPDSLRIISEYFESDEKLQVLSGKELHFGDGAEKLKYGTKIYPSLEQNIFHSVFYQPSTFWRTSIVKELEIHQSLHYLMDTYLWVLYLLKFGPDHVLKIDDTLAKFRFHNNSKSVDQAGLFAKDRWSIRVALIERLTDLSPAYSSLGRKVSSGVELMVLKSKFDLNMSELQKMYMSHLFGELKKEGYSSDARKVVFWLMQNDFRWANVKNLIKALLP